QPQTDKEERRGTKQDAEGIKNRFEALGFVVEPYENLTCSQMLRTMREVGRRNHSKNDCLALVVMSHGDEGIVYGTDGIVEVDILLAPLKGDKCPTLAGKPKLIFIQVREFYMKDEKGLLNWVTCQWPFSVPSLTLA
ncbi:caspase-7-like, partial [Lingula anatina]|uniref:Caspase-7-like n=1 Tax=Lingula anatina TaxID=7574 RepID=A0A1S3JEU3_LINAN